MKESKEALESQIAEAIADKVEKALALESDLEWWSALLESFYGLNQSNPIETRSYDLHLTSGRFN
jgi:hypothetical protein